MKTFVAIIFALVLALSGVFGVHAKETPTPEQSLAAVKELREQERYKKALAAVRTAMKTHGLSPDFLFEEAVLFRHLGNQRKYNAALLSLLKAHPNYAKAYQHIGLYAIQSDYRGFGFLTLLYSLKLDSTHSTEIVKILNANARESLAPKNIVIQVDANNMSSTSLMNQLTDALEKSNNEGIYELDLALYSEADQNLNRLDQLVNVTHRLCQYFDDNKSVRDESAAYKFVWKQISKDLNIFLEDRDLLESFIYYHFASIDEAAFRNWMKDHREELGELMEWLH